MADPAHVRPRQACPCQAMTLTRDTIAAIATPAGRGGIGVVRVSGPGVPRRRGSAAGRASAAAVARCSRSFATRTAKPIDEGLALYFPAPHSYTGEDGARTAGPRRTGRDAGAACAPAWTRARASPSPASSRAARFSRASSTWRRPKRWPTSSTRRAAKRRARRCARSSGEFSAAIGALAGAADRAARADRGDARLSRGGGRRRCIATTRPRVWRELATRWTRCSPRAAREACCARASTWCSPGGRTSASRACSTASRARSARSSRRLPAPRATRCASRSRSRACRSLWSTPRGCVSRATRSSASA